jgi:hypothetical protein
MRRIQFVSLCAQAWQICNALMKEVRLPRSETSVNAFYVCGSFYSPHRGAARCWHRKTLFCHSPATCRSVHTLSVHYFKRSVFFQLLRQTNLFVCTANQIMLLSKRSSHFLPLQKLHSDRGTDLLSKLHNFYIMYIK